MSKGAQLNRGGYGGLRRSFVLEILRRDVERSWTEADLFMAGGLHKHMTRSQLESALQWLRSAGLVERRRGGPWGLTDKGRQASEERF